MSVSGSTRILGIYGDPVSHSLSPAINNDALRRAGIDAVYFPFHIRPEDLAEAVAAIRLLGFWGITITKPHKETVLPLLDEVDADAKLIGAVNTIVNSDGRLVGYNMDSPGFRRSLQEDLDFDPRGKRVLLIGAGGAGRAAIVALARAGVAHINIFNRSAQRAELVAAELVPGFGKTRFACGGMEPSLLDAAAAEADLIVNSSAIGFKGDDFDYFPWEHLKPGACFADWVYHRGGTPWLNRARQQGFRAVDGLDILAGQAKEAFSLVTGAPPPAGAFDMSAFRAEFSEK
jgi:shikimate dehydrogenase